MTQIIHAYWTYDFIDDELSEIPQRNSVSIECQLIKRDQYYESQVTLDHENPYYQKYNTLTYGIRSTLAVYFTIYRSLRSRVLFSVRDLPPSQIESMIKNNTIETYGYLLTGGFDCVKVPITYTFVVVKHTKILTGYQIKIPCDLMDVFIKNHLDRIAQESNNIYT